jgi:uncharacterized protein
MATNTNIQKRAMIQALEKSMGIVTNAAKIVGINRVTHYKWLQDDVEYRSQVEDIENMAIDFAESKLHTQIDKCDTTAIIFFLKTKGKKRGYVEKSEMEHMGRIIVKTLNEDDN